MADRYAKTQRSERRRIVSGLRDRLRCTTCGEVPGRPELIFLIPSVGDDRDGGYGLSVYRAIMNDVSKPRFLAALYEAVAICRSCYAKGNDQQLHHLNNPRHCGQT